jgi:hypothetical protein
MATAANHCGGHVQARTESSRGPYISAKGGRTEAQPDNLAGCVRASIEVGRRRRPASFYPWDNYIQTLSAASRVVGTATVCSECVRHGLQALIERFITALANVVEGGAQCNLLMNPTTRVECDHVDFNISSTVTLFLLRQTSCCWRLACSKTVRSPKGYISISTRTATTSVAFE